MENISLLLRQCWVRSRRNGMVIAMSLLAAAFLLTPVQRYLAIARYQHYGVGICIFAFGYLLQTYVSWGALRKWAKISYLISGLFFAAVGVIFICNPWLDGRVSPRTDAHEALRILIQAFYLLSGLLVTGSWLRLVYEDMQLAEEKKIGKALPPQ